jgi:CDP-glucose 4,6-dehydratase
MEIKHIWMETVNEEVNLIMKETGFWSGKKVLITGHTGFKGSWLCLWLQAMGAHMIGFSLPPPTKPSMFDLLSLEDEMKSIMADIRDANKIREALCRETPDVIFHMAAQPLVRYSYAEPAETYMTNVIGTVNLLEAVRAYASQGLEHPLAVIVVTSDKCYENKENLEGYTEDDQLGGRDPYSNSKACAELVVSAYRNSYFSPDKYASHGVGLATVRAGNVIGGGDWANERLIPDCIRAFLSGTVIKLRHPEAIRPWQHVLEPLSGYILLAEKLYLDGVNYAEGWNFGPPEEEAWNVKEIVQTLGLRWGNTNFYELDSSDHPHEARILILDCNKAKKKLNWYPRWPLTLTLDSIIEWVEFYRKGGDMREISRRQIEAYMNTSFILDREEGST